MKQRFTTGIFLGGLLGASATMLMEMDKKQLRKMKKRMNNMQSLLRR